MWYDICLLYKKSPSLGNMGTCNDICVSIILRRVCGIILACCIRYQRVVYWLEDVV